MFTLCDLRSLTGPASSLEATWRTSRAGFVVQLGLGKPRCASHNSLESPLGIAAPSCRDLDPVGARLHDGLGQGGGHARDMGASGDTTPEEVQAAARRLYVGLAERSEVARIEPVMEPAPDAAKSGAKVAALGAMLLQVAPAAIEAVLRMVQDLLTRPGTLPTTVTKRKGRDEVARSRVRSPAHAGERHRRAGRPGRRRRRGALRARWFPPELRPARPAGGVGAEMSPRKTEP